MGLPPARLPGVPRRPSPWASRVSRAGRWMAGAGGPRARLGTDPSSSPTPLSIELGRPGSPSACHLTHSGQFPFSSEH